MKEVWKEVEGYEGLYQISNLGRVKSLPRKVKTKGGSYREAKERILKAGTSSQGYNLVSLSSNGKSNSCNIHKLVAIAFLDHIPGGYKLVVDHIDANPLNNRSDNLQIITNRLNTSKDKKNGTSKYTGVYWHKQNNKWCAKIHLNGKKKHLGYFTDEAEGGQAYINALNNINKHGQMHTP